MHACLLVYITLFCCPITNSNALLFFSSTMSHYINTTQTTSWASAITAEPQYGTAYDSNKVFQLPYPDNERRNLANNIANGGCSNEPPALSTTRFGSSISSDESRASSGRPDDREQVSRQQNIDPVRAKYEAAVFDIFGSETKLLRKFWLYAWEIVLSVCSVICCVS